MSTAVASFFDSAEDDAAAASVPAAPAAAAAAPAAAPSGPRTLGGAPAADDAPWPSAKPAAQPARARGGGIMSFSDLRGHSADEEPDDRDPVNLFAGGERSGLNVENPEARRGGDDNSLVSDILSKAATAHGRAEQPVDLQGGSSRAFAGRGHSIGGATVGEEAPEPEEEDDEESEEPAVRHLTFWQDGFSIEDGPLMRYDDPANQETLQAINSGRAPLSLLNVRFGQPVELMVARRTHEKYVPPPPPPAQPFGGSGNRLGAPAPAAAAAPRSAAPPAPPSDAPEVNDSEPTTQIQVRLSDGQRLIAKLNTTHTVGDLRRYINAYVYLLTQPPSRSRWPVLYAADLVPPPPPDRRCPKRGRRAAPPRGGRVEVHVTGVWSVYQYPRATCSGRTLKPRRCAST